MEAAGTRQNGESMKTWDRVGEDMINFEVTQHEHVFGTSRGGQSTGQLTNPRSPGKLVVKWCMCIFA